MRLRKRRFVKMEETKFQKQKILPSICQLTSGTINSEKKKTVSETTADILERSKMTLLNTPESV